MPPSDANSPANPPAGSAVSFPDAALPERFLERLRAAVDAHSIVSVADTQGVIRFVNDRFCEVSRYPRAELLGQTYRLVNSGFHPPEFWKNLWSTALAGRIWRGVIRNRAKDGTFFWVETTVTPVSGDDGHLRYFLTVHTDVTRLKRVEEELSHLTRDLERHVRERTEQVQQSETLYRLLLASVTDYHYTVEVRDGQAVSTTHTPSCLAVTGYEMEEFARNPNLWLMMVPDSDRAAVLEHARAALEGRNPPPLEHRIVRKDGQVRWIRDRIVTRRDATGRVAFYDGILTDITEEKLALFEVQQLTQSLEQRVAERTAQLKAAHDQLRVLFEHAPVGISWVERGEPDVYHLNDRFCQIIGLTYSEARSYENILKATHPDDREDQEELMARLRRGEMDSFTLEKRYVHKDGRLVWGQLTVAVLRDENGRITQHFAMLVDITDRVRAEQEARANEQRLRRYFESASEILYSIDGAGVFTFVSPAWTLKLGHALADVVGHSYLEFVHPEDVATCDAFFREVRAAGVSSRSVEYRIRHLDGTWRWHASTGSVTRDEKGSPVFFGIGRDITQRRHAQMELRASLERREELERIIARSPSIAVLWRAQEGWAVQFVSESVSQFGYQAQDLVSGRVRYIDLIHPDDVARVMDEVRAHTAAGHREYRQEYRVLRKDGQVRWVDDRTAVRFDAEGRATHHEGILTDITSRKLVEERERIGRERDLRVAHEVQQHLLPSVYPDIAAVEIDTLYTPSRLIGGDYYDFFEVGERRWGFAVADVSGKGTAAALMMAACRTALRVKAQGGWAPANVLRMVNYIVQPDMPKAMFISALYGILDLGTNVFAMARAGHEPALIVRAKDGAIEELCPAGMALGLDQGALFDECIEESVVTLGPQDMLVLFTDGITETANPEGEEFGRARLAEVLRESRHLPLAEIRQQVDRALVTFAFNAPAADDRTLLLVRPR
ncbi:MAG TPA: PAS domain S-box protein [Opitutaceae bacterium]|nr:PAS domain S-box protein [Opitutaceae bacterium]